MTIRWKATKQCFHMETLGVIGGDQINCELSMFIGSFLVHQTEPTNLTSSQCGWLRSYLSHQLGQHGFDSLRDPIVLPETLQSLQLLLQPRSQGGGGEKHWERACCFLTSICIILMMFVYYCCPKELIEGLHSAYSSFFFVS